MNNTSVVDRLENIFGESRGYSTLEETQEEFVGAAFDNAHAFSRKVTEKNELAQ